MKKNQNIRKLAKDNGIYLWQIADKLNVSPETLNRRLRHELSDSEQEQIIRIIEDLSMH